MSNRSTLIKDLKNTPPKNEDDVAVQEVLSDIEREKHIPTITPDLNQQQPHPSMFENNNIFQQQQLLQQQLLQQQLLQQQLENQQNNAKYEKMYDGIVGKIRGIMMDNNRMFMSGVVLFLVFTNMDVLGVLKIDNLTIFESYPLVEKLVISVIFGLTLVFVKQLM